jgi:hypothetical protein
LAPTSGLLLEFGVYSGSSIRFFAGKTDRRIYGFEQHKAFFEFVARYNVTFDYVGYCYSKPSSPVAVVIKTIQT